MGMKPIYFAELKVLSWVRHLGTGWPLAWAFFSSSMYFTVSSTSFSDLRGDTREASAQILTVQDIWSQQRQLSRRSVTDRANCYTQQMLRVWKSTQDALQSINMRGKGEVKICSLLQSLAYVAHERELLREAQTFLFHIETQEEDDCG